MAYLDYIRAKTGHFNRTLFFSVLLIAVSSFNYGFDNQAFATTQSMTPFARQFGELNHKTGKHALPSYWLSLFNSLNYIGFAFGVLVGSAISARFGRRWCMFSMSCYALVTATIAVTSQTREQIMAARVLNYVYVGMELSVVPTFQSEIIPAPIRGLVVGTYQLSLGMGGLVINAACYATNRRYTDNRAWRIPLGLFYIVPSIIAAGILFVPESPRWLLRQGRIDEARASLRRLRRDDHDVDAEFAELQEALVAEESNIGTHRKGRLIEVVQGRNLVRTLIVAGVNMFQQVTGQAFASQYGAVYVKSLGTFNQVLFSLMNSGINVGVMAVILYVSDKVGRRVLLSLSSVVMLGALLSMGGLGVQNPVSRDHKKGIMGLITVFGTGFSLGWGPMVYVVTTEVCTLRLRDLTVRIGFFINVLFNFAVNFSVPYLVFADYANLGSKVGFIFGSCAFLSLLFVYFCVPECKGKTLEQVDHLFQNGTRLRDFGKVQFEETDETPQSEGKVDV